MNIQEYSEAEEDMFSSTAILPDLAVDFMQRVMAYLENQVCRNTTSY
jgi:hypothetical protein